jgi:hypothetical protein
MRRIPVAGEAGVKQPVGLACRIPAARHLARSGLTHLLPNTHWWQPSHLRGCQHELIVQPPVPPLWCRGLSVLNYPWQRFRT